MKNNLIDLTNKLYAQLERLDEEEITKEQLDLECKRAEAISNISDKLIRVSNIYISAYKLVKEGHIEKQDLPKFLQDKPQLPKVD